MATIKERLAEGMKSALKGGEKNRLAFSRNLHAAVRKKEIDDRVELDDSGVQKIIASLMKQRQDSIDQFKQGGREDLVSKEEAELRFLQGFMPAQLTEEELRKIIAESIAEAKATNPKDMGNVMKILMPKIQGRSDGKRVNQLVREILEGPR